MDFQEIIESKKKPAGGGSELDQLKAELEAEKKKALRRTRRLRSSRSKLLPPAVAVARRAATKRAVTRRRPSLRRRPLLPEVSTARPPRNAHRTVRPRPRTSRRCKPSRATSSSALALTHPRATSRVSGR